MSEIGSTSGGTRQKGFFSKLVNGDFGLAKTYWLFGRPNHQCFDQDRSFSRSSCCNTRSSNSLSGNGSARRMASG